MSMILYIPYNMHSSQLTHIFNKELFIKIFANKDFQAMKRPTQGWILEMYA
jgi:hypothetical protein